MAKASTYLRSLLGVVVVAQAVFLSVPMAEQPQQQRNDLLSADLAAADERKQKMDKIARTEHDRMRKELSLSSSFRAETVLGSARDASQAAQLAAELLFDKSGVENPMELKLLYLILVHDNAASVIRLVERLQQEPDLHNEFVIHVDGKETSETTYQELVEYAAQQPRVHVLPNPYRVRVNWGGFSMVNATLQLLKYATGRIPNTLDPLEFDKVIHLSSTHYPLASNTEIRHELAKYPVDANFMNVIMKPHRTGSWNYFVECDDWVHRIFHLPVPTKSTAGFDLFTGSQWWIIGRDFAEYMASAEPGSFVHQFLPYAEHVVVSDEHFFGTVLRNTHFCTTHVNRNYLHMEFDRWESDIEAEQRNPIKCIMKDPNHCGRSPTTLSLADAPLLELSDNLFARKFLSSSKVKDLIDGWRMQRETDIREFLFNSSSGNSENLPRPPRSRSDLEFERLGVLIVDKSTVQDQMPLCLGLGDTGNLVRLVPCFHDWVPSNLLPGWETGAVIQQETRQNNRWDIAKCTTSNGRLERNNSTGGVEVLPNDHSSPETGNQSFLSPLCMLKQMEGVRAGRCFDGETGGEKQNFVFPCLPNNWGQLVSFGDGKLAPVGSLFVNVPQQHKKFVEKSGREYHPAMCLGIQQNTTLSENNDATENAILEVISVPCSRNSTKDHKILDWVVVPFIFDDSIPNPNEDGAEIQENYQELSTCFDAPNFVTLESNHCAESGDSANNTI